MAIQLLINNNPTPNANYIGWSPVPVRIQETIPARAVGTIDIRLRNQNTTVGGQVQFLNIIPGVPQDELQIALPQDGTPIDFFIAGKFPFASTVDKDAIIEVVDVATKNVVSTTSLMVRIRKNANTLTTSERDRFVAALALLNNTGTGPYSDFREVHTNASFFEGHASSGFLPWHRAYLLDLERELQNIDASVTLPYWKFDEPAPILFHRDFLGAHPQSSNVQLNPTNPLSFWVTDGVNGIDRRPRFNTSNQSAFVRNEADTLQLGFPNLVYSNFSIMEGNPHGNAHTSFFGFLRDPHTAVRDPLFFLLHTNADRLWAKWQWVNRRFDITSTDTYRPLGAFVPPVTSGDPPIGHYLDDTMWPWNQVMGVGGRPPTAPGGTFPTSSVTSAPGLGPTIREMIDYQGVLDPTQRLGFDYDDVPFEF